MPRLKKILIFAIVVSVTLFLPAHILDGGKITWSRDVSRIVYKRCASCHHEGGTAVSLVTYREVQPWLESIKKQVCSRSMPPWNAVKGFGEFQNDPSLTQEEIEIIAQWIADEAPEGDSAYLPPEPDFQPQRNATNPGEKRLVVSGTVKMKHVATIRGIQPQRVPATGVLQAIARRPDGSVEPLIWIKNFNTSYNAPYYFRNLLNLPAGTQVEVIPPGGEIALIVEGPERLSAKKGKSR
jgi:hypothetical protein